jgi:cell division protein FtsB
MRIHFLLFSSKKMWLPLVLFLIAGNFQTLTGKLDEIYLVQSKLKAQLL